MSQTETLAILIPCFNEATTISKVVMDFQEQLPDAAIYVFDNNSNDGTSEKAIAAGAEVVHSHRQGKGHVVTHMFNCIEADIYIMVDGDDTYPAQYISSLLGEFREKNADMLIASRIDHSNKDAFPRFHILGNRLIAKLISVLFTVNLHDITSGYRILSRRFVKSLTLLSSGFQVETEMTLNAITNDFVVAEKAIPYYKRPDDSHSKINTVHDGMKIFQTLFLIFKDYRPLLFFSLISLLFLMAGLFFGLYPIVDYIKTGYVEHVPLAILAAALEIIAVICLLAGIILDNMLNRSIESRLLLQKIIHLESKQHKK